MYENSEMYPNMWTPVPPKNAWAHPLFSKEQKTTFMS